LKKRPQTRVGASLSQFTEGGDLIDLLLGRYRLNGEATGFRGDLRVGFVRFKRPTNTTKAAGGKVSSTTTKLQRKV
jgi:hypothetical protein